MTTAPSYEARSRSAYGASRNGMVLGLLFLVSTVNLIDRQLPAILAEHVKRDLHLSDAQLGLLTGLSFSLVYCLAAIPLARLADRWSPKYVLIIAIGVWSAMTGLGAAAKSFLPLALTRAGVALGESGATPASHALICQLFLPGVRGRAIGIFSMGAPFGIMLGMALGGALADSVGWRGALLLAGALGVMLAIAAWFVIPDRRATAQADSSAGPLASIGALFASPPFVWMLLSLSLFGIAVYPFLAFTASFFIRIHGMTATQTGLALGVMQGTMGLLGSFAGGLVFDRAVRKGSRHLLTPAALGFMLAAPVTAAAWFVDEPALALLLLAPVALVQMFYGPSVFGAAHIIAGVGREATASSLLIIATGLMGGVVGPFVVGLLSDVLSASYGGESLRYALLLVPALLFISGVSLIFADRRLAGAAKARHLVKPSPV